MLEERKLQKAKITLMREPMFALYSGLMMVGRTSIADNVPTACTNGRDEIYGRAFVRELRDEELNFLIIHETMHKAYRHLTTWKKLHDESHELANMACDYVINIKLIDLDPHERYIAMPRFKSGDKQGKPMGLVDTRFRGMNAKQVFDILKEEQSGNSGGGDGSGQGMDEHDWEKAQEMSDEEKKELERDIDQAIRQGIMNHEKIVGKEGGEIDRDLLDLIEPKIDWREVLREFVKATCTSKDTSSWRRVNRRFLSSDVYMPSLIGERIGSIAIGVDTSGSIGAEELVDFLSEVKGIAEEVKPNQVDLIYWDSDVASHEIYYENAVSDLVASTKPRGGGGTSPSCVPEYMKEKNIKPECTVMLTDGCVGGDWGNDWPSPTLWVIVDNKSAQATNGKTIHIDSSKN